MIIEFLFSFFSFFRVIRNGLGLAQSVTIFIAEIEKQ